MDIDEAGWQAFPIATKALVLRDDLPVVQGIVNEGEAIRLYPLKRLHFAGEPLKQRATMGSCFLCSTSHNPQILKLFYLACFLY
jgi:hypothetical protein